MGEETVKMPDNMDVERLMQDLPVEKLDEICTDLKKEMGDRREKLRDMVGRRYRDVLDASKEIKVLVTRASALSSAVTRVASVGSQNQAPGPIQDQQNVLEATGAMVAAQAALALVESDEGDALSDVWALCVAEQLERRSSSAAAAISQGELPEAFAHILGSLAHRLATTRSRLGTVLRADLAELSRPDWACSQLVALALLQPDEMTLERLLEIYLQEREKMVGAAVRNDDSLVSAVREIGATLRVVDSLWTRSADLPAALQRVSHAAHWQPALLVRLAETAPLVWQPWLEEHSAHVRRVFRDGAARASTAATTSALIAGHVEKSLSRSAKELEPLIDRIVQDQGEEDAQNEAETLLELVEKIRDAVGGGAEGTTTATTTISTFAPQTVYQRLIGTKLVDRFGQVLTKAVQASIEELKRDAKDAPVEGQLFASSSSSALQGKNGVGRRDDADALKAALWRWESRLRACRDAAARYGRGKEPTVQKIDATQRKLAEATSAGIRRLFEEGDGQDGDGKSSLWLVRLGCALLEDDRTSETLCSLLSSDKERLLLETHHAIRSAVERILEDETSRVIKLQLQDGEVQARLKAVGEALVETLPSMTLVLEVERLKVDGVGEVPVPVALSPHWHLVLAKLCESLAATGAGRLLTKRLRRRMCRELGEELRTRWMAVWRASLPETGTAPRLDAQLLFDARCLALLLGAEDEDSKKLWSHEISAWERRCDPFELSLAGQTLAGNARLVTQRCQLLYGGLVEQISTGTGGGKELRQSYWAVADPVVRPPEPLPRLAPIARLVTAGRGAGAAEKDGKGATEGRGAGGGGQKKKKTAAAAQGADGKKQSAGASIYDKWSSGTWWS